VQPSKSQVVRYESQQKIPQALKDAGWHFCPDWDFMLIGPEWPEMECCTCKIKPDTKE